MKNLLDKIKHIHSRIKTYQNWYTLVWPMTGILPKDRVVKMRLGQKMYIRSVFGADFAVIHESFYRDDYEIASLIIGSPNPTIIDVGANIGSFSILANSIFKNAQIFAYEPGKSNFEILQKNIKLNNAKVKSYQLALAVKEGDATFYISKHEYAHTLSHTWANGDIIKKETIQCTTLKNVIEENNIEKIDILKLDIEGIEYEVLYGLTDNIYKIINNIVLEIHSIQGQSKDDLLKFLKSKGFNITQSKNRYNVYKATRN